MQSDLRSKFLLFCLSTHKRVGRHSPAQMIYEDLRMTIAKILSEAEKTRSPDDIDVIPFYDNYMETVDQGVKTISVVDRVVHGWKQRELGFPSRVAYDHKRKIVCLDDGTMSSSITARIKRTEVWYLYGDNQLEDPTGYSLNVYLRYDDDGNVEWKEPRDGNLGPFQRLVLRHLDGSVVNEF